MANTVFGRVPAGAAFPQQTQFFTGWNEIDASGQSVTEEGASSGFFAPEADFFLLQNESEPYVGEGESGGVFGEAVSGTDPAVNPGADPVVSPDGLTPEEQAIVAEMKLRDAEVVQHETAHATAGGAFAG